jgi:AraC-like DNA-binding protein
MDLLHHVLESLRVQDSSFCALELQRPWGFHRDAMQRDMAVMFLPLQGRCLLRMSDGQQAWLMPGDVGLVLSGAFDFQSEERVPLVPFVPTWVEQQQPPLGRTLERDGPDRFRWPPLLPQGGDMPVDRLLGIAFLVEDIARSPVLAMLPRLIVLRRDQQGPMDWCAVLQRFVEFEGHSPQPGYNTEARHLANLAFVGLLRRHVLRAGADRAGWMRGMGDPAVGQALALMHARFAEPWTLVSLAAACGLSRSTLAERFHLLVGRPPMDYLGAVRMQAAAQQLLEGNTVAAVGEAVGYASPWAFRRAFTRQWGVGPSDYLANANRPPLAA